MTSIAANDLPVPPSRHQCAIDMTVLELATFLRTYRSGVPSSTGEIAATLGSWFRCDIDLGTVSGALSGMVSRGWLTSHASGFRATRAGRRHARGHLQGIVRMLDQGTNYFDVAVMMSMLGIAKAELDGEHDDENLDD
ncbi:hypothetical protein [Sphingomonas xinjiangensis]|uniref:Uncharacterized protein n=1 Tax=Sphingomonas xinjiangensis TaxID=643568 RepID=A0A840YHG9_9SPHN|nr:hypothetical protein [Sphingomonas xinjiangensis]MBB5712344.1 hypothetical protein [Sphingomonas xinjiangensis]